MSHSPLGTLAIPQHRKLELLKCAHLILVDLPTAVKGNESMAAEIQGRIESIAKTRDEYRWLVDSVTFLINKSKGKEIQVIYRGRKYSKLELARDFGIFLKPKPNQAKTK